MSIPSFVDRLNVSVSKEVGRSFFTDPISQVATTVFKTIGVDPAAIAEPDPGYMILATTSIFVKDSTAETLRATDYVATLATKLVGRTGGDVYVQMSVNANDSVIVTQTPVIFVDVTPRTVFWA